MDFIAHMLILVGIFVILGTSFNLLVGYGGLFSMAQAAFYGIGAYTSALLAVKLGLNVFLGMLCGMALAATVSAIIAIPTLRVSGDYLAIATLGFQVIIYSTFLNWTGLTRGPAGIMRIPKPSIFGLVVQDEYAFLTLTWLLALFSIWLVWRLVSGPFGQVLRAIREDAVATQSLGKNLLRFKVLTFVVSGALAAMAGSLYAHYIGYIDPYSFTFSESVFILSTVIVGGAGNLFGPAVGVLVLVSLPEILRYVNVPSDVVGPVNQILYGVLLIVFMMFRPQGILPERLSFGGAKVFRLSRQTPAAGPPSTPIATSAGQGGALVEDLVK